MGSRPPTQPGTKSSQSPKVNAKSEPTRIFVFVITQQWVVLDRITPSQRLEHQSQQPWTLVAASKMGYNAPENWVTIHWEKAVLGPTPYLSTDSGLGPSHRLDHVQAMEPGQQRASILLHMPVVLGNQLQQQPQLLVLHRFDQKAVVIRQEEGAARLARRGQQAKGSVACQGEEVVHVVYAKELSEALEDKGAVVLPLEAAAVVAAQVLANLRHWEHDVGRGAQRGEGAFEVLWWEGLGGQAREWNGGWGRGSSRGWGGGRHIRPEGGRANTTLEGITHCIKLCCSTKHDDQTSTVST